jgi:hypothetical protein
VIFIIVSLGEGEKAVCCESGFFIPENNVFREQWILQNDSAAQKKTGSQNSRCFECGRSIGVVSKIIYNIEETQFCSKCYFKNTIGNLKF